MKSETSPLAGVRVIDLTRLVPGAFATLMLAELGADVIKIEDPNGGDPMRRFPPLLDGRGLFHLLLDRGKKSVALDLRQAGERARLDALLETADVVIESFRPQTARRLGVAGEQLRARWPRLIHCAITGYGQTGPYAERPGHDLNYVSISGFLAADRPNPAELPRMFIADIGGGAMSAVIGILAALFGRTRSGEGAAIDISMHEAALYWMMLPAARDLVEGGDRAGASLPTFGDHACYNIYRTKDDRLLALGALEDKFWRGFCAAIGRPDLAVRQHADGADQAALVEEVRAIFRTRTRDEWLAHFGAHEVCLTPVNTPAEALRDPHVVARGAVGGGAGTRAIRAPFLGRAVRLGAAPELGADSGELAEKVKTEKGKQKSKTENRKVTRADWDPAQYLKFADERARPCADLIARVLVDRPRRVVDLGCGPGNSTRALAARWPEADVTGIDSSPEMIATARAGAPARTWIIADIRQWAALPAAAGGAGDRDDRDRFDVVFSNAALQWVPDHATLFPALFARVAPGGAFAVQMPCDDDGPAHRPMREVASSPRWRAMLADTPTWHSHPPAFYYDVLAPHAARLDIWRTEYEHILPSADAIVEWYAGSGLRPYLARLADDADRAAFLADYRARLEPHYQPRADGRVVFPFVRLFLVASA